MVPLEKGLSLILEGADITEANREIAIRNFIEAFEEGYSLVNVFCLFGSCECSLTSLLKRLPCASSAVAAEPEELKRLIEKYPKLVQKYSLQPQLCCDLVVAWEEHCLDMLTESELVWNGYVCLWRLSYLQARVQLLDPLFIWQADDDNRQSLQAKHGRSIAAFDMCRFDDPIAATAEAKKKYQAIFKMRKCVYFEIGALG